MEKLKWPYHVEYLSQALDPELIQYIQSGISARMERAFTVVELRDGEFHFIPTIKKDQNWTNFCRFLRNDLIKDLECSKCDREHAEAVFNSGSNDPTDYLCWMELADFAAPVLFEDRKIATIFTGQCIYEGTIPTVKEHFDKMADQWNEESTGSVSDEQRETAHQYIESLPIIDYHMLEDIKGQLRQEAERISELAIRRYKEDKHEKELTFLREIDDQLQRPNASKPEKLWRIMKSKVLPKINEFCGFQYSVFMCTDAYAGKDLLPSAVAWAGIDVTNPHSIMFDWQAAKLGENYRLANLGFDAETQARMRSAVIGGIPEPGCVIPVSLPDSFKGALILGPTSEDRTYPEDWQISEVDFLRHIGSNVGMCCLIFRQIAALREDRELRERLLTQLAHTIRQDVSSVSTTAQYIQLRRNQYVHELAGMTEDKLMEIIDKRCDHIVSECESFRETLDSILTAVRSKKPRAEDWSGVDLYAVLQSIKDKYIDLAGDRVVDIVIDDGISELPNITANARDVYLALSNVVHNAIKYSHKDQQVRIEGSSGTNWVRVSIRDYGTGIVGEDEKNIFVPGYRGMWRGDKEDEEGFGYGLSDALNVVQAHGGSIKFESYTGKRKKESKPGAGYVTVFHVTLPIDPREGISQED